MCHFPLHFSMSSPGCTVVPLVQIAIFNHQSLGCFLLPFLCFLVDLSSPEAVLFFQFIQQLYSCLSYIDFCLCSWNNKCVMQQLPTLCVKNAEQFKNADFPVQITLFWSKGKFRENKTSIYLYCSILHIRILSQEFHVSFPNEYAQTVNRERVYSLTG